MGQHLDQEQTPATVEWLEVNLTCWVESDPDGEVTRIGMRAVRMFPLTLSPDDARSLVWEATREVIRLARCGRPIDPSRVRGLVARYTEFTAKRLHERLSPPPGMRTAGLGAGEGMDEQDDDRLSRLLGGVDDEDERCAQALTVLDGLIARAAGRLRGAILSEETGAGREELLTLREGAVGKDTGKPQQRQRRSRGSRAIARWLQGQATEPERAVLEVLDAAAVRGGSGELAVMLGLEEVLRSIPLEQLSGVERKQRGRAAGSPAEHRGVRRIGLESVTQSASGCIQSRSRRPMRPKEAAT